MKTRIIKTLGAALCGLLLLYCFPVGALQTSEDDFGYDKLEAFWRQEAYDGLTNGDAVYDHEWIQDVFYFDFGFDPTDVHFLGGWNTPLVHYTNLSSFELVFTAEFWYCFEDEIEPGVIVSGEGIDSTTPDLYGPLDLSDTFIGALCSPQEDQTHITSVSLDSCERLYYVDFNGQKHITDFSAVGSTGITKLSLKENSLKRIALTLPFAEKNIVCCAFGTGSVGAEFNAQASSERAILNAYNDDGAFCGWYKDGVKISSSRQIAAFSGGEYFACFGGDANGDGIIDSLDALTELRCAMGLCEIPSSYHCDINGDGVIGIEDALLIMRFTLGMH